MTQWGGVLSPEEEMAEDPPDDAVGDTVGERHEDDGDEGGDALAGVHPVDVGTVLEHQGAHDDDGGAGGVGRDARKDG